MGTGVNFKEYGGDIIVSIQITWRRRAGLLKLQGVQKDELGHGGEDEKKSMRTGSRSGLA